VRVLVSVATGCAGSKRALRATKRRDQLAGVVQHILSGVPREMAPWLHSEGKWVKRVPRTKSNQIVAQAERPLWQKH
jgi:hypothetical protein